MLYLSLVGGNLEFLNLLKGFKISTYLNFKIHAKHHKFTYKFVISFVKKNIYFKFDHTFTSMVLVIPINKPIFFIGENFPKSEMRNKDLKIKQFWKVSIADNEKKREKIIIFLYLIFKMCSHKYRRLIKKL